MRQTALAAILCLVFEAATWAAARAQESCQSIFEAAQDERELAQLKLLHAQALLAGDCDDAFRTALGRRVATSIANRVDRSLQAGSPPMSQEGLLERSLGYYRLWQVLAMLGDIAFDRGDYERATRRFQESLEVIDDPGLTPQAPSESVIRVIFHKAEETRLAASSYVPAPSSRAGEPTGLAADSVRGFVATKVAVPITFEFDSTAFTAEGDAAVRDMLAYLQAQGAPDITLIGHTDPRGSDGYNQSLSERRAKTVRKHLKNNGYGGRITALGRGERDPYEADDPSRYSREALHQLHRRVELLR